MFSFLNISNLFSAMSSRSSSPENDIFASSIIPEREVKHATTTEIDFDGRLDRPLILHEDLKDGCGGQLWPAGMTLAKYMLAYHDDLRGKSILEIGAGGGLVGLAVARGCQMNFDQQILITDQLPMLPLMQKNISLNHLDSNVKACVYDWGEPIPNEVTDIVSTTSSSLPDIVLAADCVYFEPAFPLLLKTLSDIIGPHTTCYFCFKKRRKADMRFIRDMMKTFQVTEVEYDEREVDKKNNIHLYQLMRKSKSAIS